MWPNTGIAGVLLAALLITSGMADEAATTEAPSDAAKAAPREAQEAAKEAAKPSDPDKSTFKGIVKFEGAAPAPRRIQITKDAEICSAGKTEFQEVVLGQSGGLSGAVVEITGVKPPKGTEWKWKKPKEGYVLRQKDCGFVPSLLVMPNGSTVKVFNDDPVAHNVNTGRWNEMQAKAAPAIEKPIEGRSPFRVSCNIHSWMEAWIYPAQSPLHALTDKNGKFTIKNVPPGRYRISVWHPNLGKQRERFEFTPGETVEHTFTYEAK